MEEVRLGVIGCGNMATGHMKYFDQVPRLKFTAAADVNKASLDKVVENHQVKGFERGEDMIASGLCDAILIATPHYSHPTFAQLAIQNDLHVLVEKPIAVTVRAADEMNAVAATRPKLVYAAMFNQRTSDTYNEARRLIQEGELGEIQRVRWTITDWFRSQAYYNSGSWRATWAGEGGGVLLNQCPHNLDLLIWITGKPTLVQAFISLGKYHRIEVEDEVTAYLEYENGATGVFITTTGEAPGANELEIAGDRGRMVVRDGKITVQQTAVSVKEFCHTSTDMFKRPEVEVKEIEVPKGGIGGHQGITVNFIEAILDGKPLIAPAHEGIHSVELANAMILSGIRKKPVSLPVDRDEYEALMAELIESARQRGKTVRNA
ncbi:MAG: Gfo/Idh/MocA family oxidoreductase [Phycisphaeraceae bacterium]|nr:Gfo/Idh/MocA family oxidoreductase [Phycisphaeraceae bacterium]